MKLLSACLVALLAAAGEVAAARNNPTVHLEFVPQQTIGGASPMLDPVMQEQRVTIEIVEGRRAEDATTVGKRSDDSDQWFTLRADSDVPTFVGLALNQTARLWDIRIGTDGEAKWKVKLMAFHVVETNQAVGAMFEANVAFDAELTNRAGAVVWRGSVAGDASRYGKKFSNSNCNEVLSDALVEAFGALVTARGLQDKWDKAGKDAAPVRESAQGPVGGEAVVPARLLEDVLRLLGQGFDVKTVLEFVGRQRLTTALGAQDLADWKDAGVPEEVIRVALTRPVE